MPGSVYHRIKSRNKYRKSGTLKFALSKKYLWELFEAQQRKCALSGIPLDWEVASLDRIDSNKEYIQSNVQWVHKDINKMKFDLEQKYFIEMCELIVKNKTRDEADFK